VIVCWSEPSAASNWVREEAALALDSRTYFPVMLQRCELPAGFRELNAYDLTKWDPYSYNLAPISGVVQLVSERLNVDGAERQKALRRRRFGRVLEALAFSAFALALTSAIAAVALFGLEALPPDYAPAARFGICALALATAFWAPGALFGLGLRGRGALARFAMAAAAIVVAWFGVPAIAPALVPVPLQLLAPHLLEFRHSTYKNAPLELLETAPTQVVTSVSFVRGDRPATAVVRAIKARVSVDGGQFLDPTANHFTLLKEQSTAAVPGAPFTPNIAPIGYPQVLDGSPSSEVVFAYERPILWPAMLTELVRAERSIDLDLTVEIDQHNASRASCSAVSVAETREQLRAVLADNRYPPRITFLCR
jgi:hypothetical protein